MLFARFGLCLCAGALISRVATICGLFGLVMCGVLGDSVWLLGFVLLICSWVYWFRVFGFCCVCVVLLLWLLAFRRVLF